MGTVLCLPGTYPPGQTERYWCWPAHYGEIDVRYYLLRVLYNHTIVQEPGL
jgi:hypothetical protein